MLADGVDEVDAFNALFGVCFACLAGVGDIPDAGEVDVMRRLTACTTTTHFTDDSIKMFRRNFGILVIRAHLVVMCNAGLGRFGITLEIGIVLNESWLRRCTVAMIQ